MVLGAKSTALWTRTPSSSTEAGAGGRWSWGTGRWSVVVEYSAEFEISYRSVLSM